MRRPWPAIVCQGTLTADTTSTLPPLTNQVSLQQVEVNSLLWEISTTPPSNSLMAVAKAPRDSLSDWEGRTGWGRRWGFSLRVFGARVGEEVKSQL